VNVPEVEPIKTAPYVLDEEAVMRVAKRTLRRMRAFRAVAVIVFVLVLGSRKPEPLCCAMQFAFFYACYSVLKYFSDVHKFGENFTKTDAFVLPRWHEIDDVFFATYLGTGEYVKRPFGELFKKVEFRDGNYMLHMADKACLKYCYTVKEK